LPPRLPDDEVSLLNFDRWTVGHLHKFIEAHAAAMKMTAAKLLRLTVELGYEQLKNAVKAENESVKQRKRWDQLVQIENSVRTVLPLDMLERIGRLDDRLERSLFKTLREIKHEQAARSFTIPVVSVIDVGPDTSADQELTNEALEQEDGPALEEENGQPQN